MLDLTSHALDVLWQPTHFICLHLTLTSHAPRLHTVCLVIVCGCAQVQGTRFSHNVATEGAGIFLLSAVEHLFEGCTWESNRGFRQHYAGSLDELVVARGAGLYAGVFGINVTVCRHNCVLMSGFTYHLLHFGSVLAGSTVCKPR